MNCRRLIWAATCALASLVFATSAQAQEKTRVDVSAGLKFGAAMSTASKVPDLTNEQLRQYNQQYQDYDDTGLYPSFGVGAGFGLALEARFWEVVGLETGFYYMQDDATGWEDKKVNGVDQGRIYMDQEVSALHIPLLLKANVNTDTIKPFIGFGLEFVLQQSSSLGYRTEPAEPGYQYVDTLADHFEQRNDITTSSYTMLQLTTGIEVDLGYLRIPVEIRAGYHLGWDDSFDARVDPQQQDDGSYKFVYDGGYTGHFGVFTGVMYDYDFLL